MTSKSVAVSVRLSQEDAEFVTSFDTPDASTPSDKLRAIIAELREIKSSMHDYGNSLVTLKNLVQNTQQRLLTSERKLNLHSDVTAKIGEWLPEIMAFYMTAVSAGKKEVDRKTLETLEDGLLKRVFSLFSHMMRLGITEESPTYDKKAVRRQLQPVMELSGIIELQRKK